MFVCACVALLPLHSLYGMQLLLVLPLSNNGRPTTAIQGGRSRLSMVHEAGPRATQGPTHASDQVHVTGGHWCEWTVQGRPGRTA